MIFLTATTDSLEVVTTVAGSVDVTASYNDINTTTYAPVPGRTDTSITTAATTAIVAAPAASTIRQIKFLSVSNKSLVAQTITLQVNANGTRRAIGSSSIILQSGEALMYEDGQGVSVLDPFARPKEASSATIANPPGRTTPYFVSEPDLGAILQRLAAEQRLTNMILQHNFGTDFDFDQVVNEQLNTAI